MVGVVVFLGDVILVISLNGSYHTSFSVWVSYRFIA